MAFNPVPNDFSQLINVKFIHLDNFALRDAVFVVQRLLKALKEFDAVLALAKVFYGLTLSRSSSNT